MRKSSFILTLIMVAVLLVFTVSAGAQDKIKIGFSQYTLGAPYFKAQVEAAKAKAEEVGVELVAIDAQDDMVKQLGDVEDYWLRVLMCSF